MIYANMITASAYLPAAYASTFYKRFSSSSSGSQSPGSDHQIQPRLEAGRGLNNDLIRAHSEYIYAEPAKAASVVDR